MFTSTMYILYIYIYIYIYLHEISRIGPKYILWWCVAFLVCLLVFVYFVVVCK